MSISLCCCAVRLALALPLRSKNKRRIFQTASPTSVGGEKHKASADLQSPPAKAGGSPEQEKRWFAHPNGEPGAQAPGCSKRNNSRTVQNKPRAHARGSRLGRQSAQKNGPLAHVTRRTVQPPVARKARHLEKSVFSVTNVAFAGEYHAGGLQARRRFRIKWGVFRATSFPGRVERLSAAGGFFVKSPLSM